MKKVITGNHAVSWGVRLSRVEVISAYPITPQTSIVEELSEFCADGTLKAKFIKVESEHSAMASIIGSEMAGARSFTATSAQGLALMHEVLHWAAGARLPLVLANVNRAMAPGWSIWTDQNDSLSQRDTGWLQLYAESSQEVLDTIIQSYKLAETINLPVMIMLDAFFLSHTAEIVDIPDQELVDKFLPPYKPKFKLDINDPHAFGALLRPDIYYEFRYNMQKAMEQAFDVLEKIDNEYFQLFGRKYGIVEEYKTDGAEILLVTSATVTGTARVVIDELRKNGKKVGLLKIRLFRPFPKKHIINILPKFKKVAIIDRNISFGFGGIFAQEIKSSLYDLSLTNSAPVIFPFIAGLGGRDITPQTIKEIIEYTEKHDKPDGDIIWQGVKL